LSRHGPRERPPARRQDARCGGDGSAKISHFDVLPESFLNFLVMELRIGSCTRIKARAAILA